MPTPLVVGYVRPSRVPTEPHHTPKAQAEAILAYCEAAKLPEPVILEEPKRTSAKTPLGERPAGKKIARLARDRHPTEDGPVHLVLPALDRAFLDSEDMISTLEQLHARGVRVHLVELGLVTTDATESVYTFWQTVRALTKLQRAGASERARETRMGLAEAGKRIGTVPYGYRADRDGNLVHDPADLTTLGAIHHLYVEEGVSIRELPERLNHMGSSTKTGKAWTRHSVWSAWCALKKDEELRVAAVEAFAELG